MGHEPESRLQGMFREYLDNNRSELHDTYEKSFSLYRRADRLLLEIMDNIHPTNDEPEEATTAHRCRVLCLRFYKAMRAAFLLIENDCTVDAFSAVRNMLECCLALACILKDEKAFFEIIDDDLFKSREGIFRHVDKTSLVGDLNASSKETLRINRNKFRELKESGKTFKQAGASVFYELVKDVPDSEYVYFVYRCISNMYSHISAHSLSIDIKDDEGRLRYGGIDKKEMDTFTHYAIEAFIVFVTFLDTRFGNNRHQSEVNNIFSSMADLVEETFNAQTPGPRGVGAS